MPLNFTSTQIFIENAVHSQLVPGRLSAVTFTWSDNWKLRLINVHIPPGISFASQSFYVDCIRDLFFKESEGLVICGGDFNFGVEPGDFVRLNDPHYTPQISGIANYWRRTLGHVIEHFQPDFTRADRTSAADPTAARLDRLYSNHNKLFLQTHQHNVDT